MHPRALRALRFELLPPAAPRPANAPARPEDNGVAAQHNEPPFILDGPVNPEALLAQDGRARHHRVADIVRDHAREIRRLARHHAIPAIVGLFAPPPAVLDELPEAFRPAPSKRRYYFSDYHYDQMNGQRPPRRPQRDSFITEPMDIDSVGSGVGNPVVRRPR